MKSKENKIIKILFNKNYKNQNKIKDNFLLVWILVILMMKIKVINNIR